MRQPLPRYVQPALDRADRRAELVAHLQQRLAVEVERHERIAIERRQLVEARSDLRPALGVERGCQRRRVAGRFKAVAQFGHGRTPAHGPVEGHSLSHRPQPAGEAARIAQLADLPHRLDEHFLANLLRVGMVAQSPQRDGVNGALELLDQLPTPALGATTRANRAV